MNKWVKSLTFSCRNEYLKTFTLLIFLLPTLAYTQEDRAFTQKVIFANKQGIIMYMGWSNEESGSFNTQDFSFLFFNFGKKTIKYIWTTVAIYNPVKDLIQKKAVQAVGPIEPEASGQYDFNAVFMSNIAHEAKVVGLKIQFMDKTIKEFPASMIPKICLTPEELQKMYQNQK